MKKKIIILGAGESGVGAALLAKQQGYDVFVSDGGKIAGNYVAELSMNEIPFEQENHSEERILAADEVVKSPGIPEKAVIVKKIRARNISVISEIEFAYRFIGNSKVVAITGSNGKSTTTALTYHICRHANMDCAMVGNIGYSFARQVAENPKELYVAEIIANQGPTMKRWRAGAQGRASQILKRSSHISVTLKDNKSETEVQ